MPAPPSRSKLGRSMFQRGKTQLSAERASIQARTSIAREASVISSASVGTRNPLAPASKPSYAGARPACKTVEVVAYGIRESVIGDSVLSPDSMAEDRANGASDVRRPVSTVPRCWKGVGCSRSDRSESSETVTVQPPLCLSSNTHMCPLLSPA